jgi:hypothetical protein
MNLGKGRKSYNPGNLLGDESTLDATLPISQAL